MSSHENLQTRNLIHKFLGTAGVQLTSRGLTVISGIILARLLGPQEFGSYGLIMSIVTMATVPTIAGMPQLIIREVASAQLEKRWCEFKGLLRWSSLYVLVTSAIMMCVLSVAIHMEWVRQSIGQYLWFGLAIIPMRGLLAKQNAVLNGLRFPILAQLPQGIVASVILLIALGFTLLATQTLSAKYVLTIQIGSSLGAVLFSGYLVMIKSPKELKQVNPIFLIKRWHSALLPFTLLAVISTLNNELASVMLGFLGSEEAVGYFKVSLQGVTLLSIGLTAINTVTGPNIARLYKKQDLEGMQKLLKRSVRLSVITAIPFALFLIIFGDWIVLFLFGKEYLPASDLLTILCLGQIVNVLMGSVGLVLQMTGNEKKAVKSLIFTFLLNVIFLYILVPSYGGYGAAISTTLTMIVWNFIMAYEVYSTTRLKTWIS